MPKNTRDKLVVLSSRKFNASQIVRSNSERPRELATGDIVAAGGLHDIDRQVLLAHKQILLNPPDIGAEVLLGGCPPRVD